MMKKLGLSIVAFCIVALSGAQSVSQVRVDAIWDAAKDRISTQLDSWFEDGDYPAVISLLGVQFELDTSNDDVATNLGWMQENVERYDDALATYIRYRELNPNDPNRSLPEAQFYFREKAYAKIPALLEPVIHATPHPHANVYRILAHCYEKQGLYGDAKRVYETFLSVDPTDLPAKANLAKVEKKLSAG